jgi:hypothetical protein
MPTDKHSELEYKFDAKKVNENEFLTWGILRKPVKYLNSSCPDIYYINKNKDVVRHRWGSEAGTLTVKQRKSMTSIANRVEVDLEFAPGIVIPDITKFLIASGWKKTLTIWKDAVHVFWFEESDASITLSLYTVKKLHEKTQKCGKPRTFLEVEVEKGSNLTDEAAGVLLEKWKNELMTTFSLDKPMNLSLFELFSGKTYKKAK